MKKYFYAIIIILLASCDKKMDYDYFIINECEQNINVYLVDYNNVSQSIVIPSHAKKIIYHGEGINELQDRLVEYFFIEIIIHKEDQISTLNYIDKNLWEFEPTNRNHANSYLTINPEDFE